MTFVEGSFSLTIEPQRPRTDFRSEVDVVDEW